MYVISFQGVCYFHQPADGGVVVYLPKCPDGTTHSDGTEARQHFPRVFCQDDSVDDQRGFSATSATVQRNSGTVRVDGWQFRLDNPTSPQGYRISVWPQRGRVNREILKTQIPSFSEFAGGLQLDTENKLAARAMLSGGYLDVRPSPVDWKVKKTLHHSDKSGEKALGRVGWSVDWHLSSPDEPPELRIFDGLEQVAAVALTKTRDPLDQVIIGNLDEENAAAWPDRKNTSVQDCEDDGCPDKDFKWLYRLFDEAAVQTRRGSNALPVPVLHGHPVGLDTPTCFPGGD